MALDSASPAPIPRCETRPTLRSDKTGRSDSSEATATKRHAMTDSVPTLFDKLRRLLRSHGALQSGAGLTTGVIALSLGVLSLLAVIAFHFPAYLTTPELRKNYDVATLRGVLLAAMSIAGALSLINIAFNRKRWLSGTAFAMVALTALFGGHTVPVDGFSRRHPVHRARLVHPRPARLHADLRVHREVVRAASRATDLPS